MKTIIISFIFLLVGTTAFAASPSTTCPTGYIAVSYPDFILSDNCATGYISAGTLTSCLITETNGCWMYIPAGTSFTDDSGTYEYTQSCPML